LMAVMVSVMNPMHIRILDRAITGIFCRMDTFFEHAPPISTH
jgi:hypothetical protein